jgi:hypothetical protein
MWVAEVNFGTAEINVTAAEVGGGRGIAEVEITAAEINVGPAEVD